MIRFAARVVPVVLVSLVFGVGCSRGSRKQPPSGDGPQPSLVAPPTTMEFAPGQSPTAAEPKLLVVDAASESNSPPVALYDELATIFEQTRNDCAAMAASSSAAIEKHTLALQRWSDATAKLSAAERAEQDERLKQSDGARMLRFRDRLEGALRNCSVELMPVFTELSRYSPSAP